MAIYRTRPRVSCALAPGRPRDVHGERAMVGCGDGHDGVRVRSDDTDAPHVIDPLRRVVARRRRPRRLAEVAVAGLTEETHLEVAGLRVHVTGDDRDALAAPRREDRAHLLLPDRARVADVVEMRRHDEDVADPRPDGAARLVTDRRLDRELDPFHIG